MKKQQKINSELTTAIKLQQAGDLDAAKVIFEKVLKSDPRNVAASYSLAAIFSNQDNIKALRYIDKAIESNPAFAMAHIAKAQILIKLSKPSLARKSLEMGRKLDPNAQNINIVERDLINAEAMGVSDEPKNLQGQNCSQLSLQGVKAQDSGDMQRAADLFERALLECPTDFVALYSLALINSRQHRYRDSIPLLERCIASAPERHEGYLALGVVYQNLGLFEESLQNFNVALALNTKCREAYVNKSTLLTLMGRHKDSLLTIEVALSNFPDDEGLLNNYGHLLSMFKMNSQASNAFKTLIKKNPDYENGLGLLLFSQLHGCDWSDYKDLSESIISGVRQGKNVCNPFAMMSITDDGRLHRKTAELFGEKRFPVQKNMLYSGKTYKHRKTRIGFISSDFREHPVGYLFVGIIEALDKSRIETIGISCGIRDGSDFYKRYRLAFDHYLDFEDKTSEEIARILYGFEVDILIDLSGYTSGSKLDVLAYRPAPIQMTYLGYPGTLSLPYVDYLIGDQITTPIDRAENFSEKLLNLPHCYLPRDSKREKSAIPKHDRKFHGIGDSRVVCSFNHDYKINPPMFDIWMRLLSEHSDLKIWLMKLNEDAQVNLVKEAKSRDIDPERLIFATRLPRVEDHLDRYRHVEFCLDTFPYNGHTTTSDALFAGADVITLQGDGFASRVASSLIHDHGDTELVTRNYSEYYECAKRLLSGSKPRPTNKSDQEQIESSTWISNQEQADALVELILSAEVKV